MTSPVVDRATITPTSEWKSTHPSAYSADGGASPAPSPDPFAGVILPPTAVSPRSDSAARTAPSDVSRRTAFPRPSYAPLRDLSMRGRPRREAADDIEPTSGMST